MIKIQEHLENEKKLYIALLKYIDCEENAEEKYVQLINIFEKQNFGKNLYDTREMLLIFNKALKNHQRKANYLTKIEQILVYFSDTIKETFTNLEIFKIFKSNKQILLLLFKNKIIVPDETIADMIHFMNYQFYFYPEISSFLDEKKKQSLKNKMIQYNENVFDNFEEKRQQGENESYICSLIRNDSVEKFVAYVNQTNLSISSIISPSIFETNSFLSKQKPTLIEYAAFFGAIQIFQYLRINKVELTKSLWLFAIHGRNPELIHILEEDKVEPIDNTYYTCLRESIKCHHNEIAIYINDNFLVKKQEEDQPLIELSYCYHNFQFIPTIFEVKYTPYLFAYDYIPIVDIALNAWDIKSTNKIIQNTIFYKISTKKIFLI